MAGVRVSHNHGVPRLKERIVELERQLAELTKRFEEYVARPVHDPFRPIGPRPGHSPWERIGHDREPGDEVRWPPATRHL